MSLLALDYGRRRIGVAHADELLVPVPLPAVTTSSPEARWEALAGLARDKGVDKIVLGHPVRPDGSSGEMAREVEDFAAELRRRLALPVELVDERETSREAGAHWNLRKARRERASGKLDSAAAVLILRNYLEEHGTPPLLPEDHA